MLKDWSVSNFKAIATTRVVNEEGIINDKIVFQPLTILCGANSSGKSSLLQSLLLMAQTMRHQSKDIPLIMNGAFINLGKFSDIKTENSKCDNVKFCFTYEPSEGYDFSSNNYPFSNRAFNDPDDVEYIKDTYFSVDFSKVDNELLPELSNFNLKINFDYPFYTLEYYNIEKKEKLNKNVYFTEEGPDTKTAEINIIFPDEKCEWNHFLPKKIKINGKHIITMKILKNIYFLTLFSDDFNFHFPPDIYPDKMIKLAKDLDLYWDKDIGIDFYYANRITEKIFSYLKDDLFYDIQGIDILFDLKDFQFKNETQGYRIKDLKWINNFSLLTQPARDEVIDRIKNNIHNIYNKILDELSNIKELISNINFAQEQNIYDDFIDAKLCCDFFFDDFNASEDIENYLSEISNYFSSNISYLGPLREDPKPLYPVSELSYTKDIGKKGENTAAILALHGEDEDIFPIPDLDNCGLYKKEKKPLKDIVIEWLKYIGVVEDIEAKIEQGGFSLKVKTSNNGRFSDLTNVGVGVSQVIPIVTMCLSAKKGSTLIIEQPELHLHPKMQTKLTDFFVAISQSGRQCIVETHSEHFINALRYRVAKTTKPEDENLAKNVKIYFVEKDEEGTLFKAIGINKYAAMSDWPVGFFDESYKTAKQIMNEVINKMEAGKQDE